VACTTWAPETVIPNGAICTKADVAFMHGTDVSMEVSRRLVIPLLTASTPASERHAILLDSRGRARQHTQRLGRLLRRKGDHVASLFELVAAGT